MPHSISIWEMLLRLALAAVLGFAVGVERYLKEKPLDFRPFMLVGMGSTLAVIVTMELMHTYGKDVDPSRMFAGIVSGIGFLGAGAIFRSGGLIQGASTGASVWMIGSIGIACGTGAYALAIAGALGALIIFLILGPLTAHLKERIGDVNGSIQEEREARETSLQRERGD